MMPVDSLTAQQSAGKTSRRLRGIGPNLTDDDLRCPAAVVTGVCSSCRSDLISPRRAVLKAGLRDLIVFFGLRPRVSVSSGRLEAAEGL